MLTCKQVAALLSSETAADAPISNRLKVKLHLYMCRNCRGYAAQLSALGRAGRELGKDCEGEPETVERLERAIVSEIERWGRSSLDAE